MPKNRLPGTRNWNASALGSLTTTWRLASIFSTEVSRFASCPRSISAEIVGHRSMRTTSAERCGEPVSSFTSSNGSLSLTAALTASETVPDTRR